MENPEPEPDAGHYELTDPDVRLMLQVREDNAAAFEELVRRYQDRLVGILQHLTHGRAPAEDLAQEVFMRVFRARKRYQPQAKFSTWLFTIANNVARNALRSNSRNREVSVSTTASGGLNTDGLATLATAGSGLMPARILDKVEISEIMRMAIEALGERQRMALLLSKFEGMSYVDIAETMQLSPQAIKSLLSRARTNLREILEPYMNSGQLPFAATPSRDAEKNLSGSGSGELN